MSHKNLAFYFILLPLFFAGWLAPSLFEGFFYYAEAQIRLQVPRQLFQGTIQLFDDRLNAEELRVADRIIGERRAIKRKRSVRLDSSLLAEKRGNTPATFKNRVEFNLFPNVRRIGQMTKGEERPDGTFIWEGRIEGQPKSRATLVSKGNVVVGNIYTEEGIYEIRSGGSGVHTVQLIDPGDMPEDRHAAPPRPGTRSFIPDFSAMRTEETATIDLLVFYTDAVANATGAFEVLSSIITLMVREANEAFTNSNIPLQLRLVGVRNTTYDDSGDMYSDIQAITDTSSRVASREIHQARDELRADIVTLLVKSADACGMGWQIGPENYADFDGSAFNVVDVDCASNYVLAHEIGHNLGAGHTPPDQPEEWPPRYNYSYAYQDPQGDFRTVMAYRCPNNESCPRIPYFSNPTLRFDGQAMGVANQSDNTRTIMRTRELAAYWRQSGNEITTRQVPIFEGAALVEQDENAQGEELGVSSVRLPGSAFHLFRNITREARLVFTRNPEQRAEILLNAANERIAEANTLARQGDTERAALHLRNYTSAIQRAGEALAGVRGGGGEELRQRAVSQELLHQGILGNLERRVSPERLGEVREARTRALEEVGKTLGDIKDDNKVNEAIVRGLHHNTSPFRPLRNLEILQAVGEKAPESAKGVLDHAKRDATRRLKGQIENLPEDKKMLLADYVDKSGGDEVSYIKVFDTLKVGAISKKTDEAMSAAKEKVFERLGKRVNEISEKKPEDIKIIFGNLSDGKIEDLRALQDIDRNLAPSAKAGLEKIKKEALDKFESKVAGLDSEAKRKYLEEEVFKFKDLKQVEVLDSLKQALPKEKQATAEEFKSGLFKEIRKDLQDSKTSKEREAKLRIIAGDREGDLKKTEELRNELGAGNARDVAAKQKELFEKKLDYIKDSERLKLYEEKAKESVPALIRKIELKKEELLKEEVSRKLAPQPTRPTTSTSGKAEQALCAREYKLVCGADGFTYTNRCVAETEHGMKVAYEGECKPLEAKPVPVSEPIKIIESQKVEPVTTGCTKEYVPVCGVNGLTYQNICFAKDANVSVQYSGSCKATEPAVTTEPTKTETTITTACAKEYIPVCGTNNLTYTNSCFAKEAGVGAQYSGECKATTTIAPTEPAKTEIITTTVCTKEYVPVCGIDNKTYDNSCLAKQSGVGVQYSGQCKTTTTTTTSDTATTKTIDTTTTQTQTTTVPKPVINSFCCGATVVAGSKVTLKWDVSGADGGVFLNGSKMANPGSMIVAPLKTIIYTLNAKNSAGVEVSSSITLTVK